MNRPIWTLPLSKHTINKLDKLGYKCCEDLIDSLGNIFNFFSFIIMCISMYNNYYMQWLLVGKTIVSTIIISQFYLIVYSFLFYYKIVT